MRRWINDLSATMVLVALNFVALFGIITTLLVLLQRDVSVPFGIVIGSLIVLALAFFIGVITSE